jgi:hypothetical protein
MDRIRSLVGMARRRLFLQEWLCASMTAAVVSCGILLVLVLERRLLGFGAAAGVPSRSAAWLLIAVIVMLAVAALAGWIRVRSRMRSEADVALELDARIRSGERLSTALALAADAGAALGVAGSVIASLATTVSRGLCPGVMLSVSSFAASAPDTAVAVAVASESSAPSPPPPAPGKSSVRFAK